MAQLAEILGGLGVVASLIYVGIQIRTSNRVNQANSGTRSPSSSCRCPCSGRSTRTGSRRSGRRTP